MERDQEKIDAIKDAYKTLADALDIAINSGLVVSCSINATDTYCVRYVEISVRRRDISAVRTIT